MSPLESTNYTSQKLVDSWKAFLRVLLDPWVLILLALTICLYYLSIKQIDSDTIFILNFLVALFSGVLGGIIANKWDEATEEKLITTRAKSASRSLGLLLNFIITLEKRVRQFLNRYNEGLERTTGHHVMKTNLEEIIKDCLSLEEKVINSIEDWKDILPNLEVQEVLKLFRDLNAKADEASLQIERINKELNETKNKSEEIQLKLQKEKEILINDLKKLNKELNEKSFQIGVPALSTSLISGSTDTFSSNVEKNIYNIYGQNPVETNKYLSPFTERRFKSLYEQGIIKTKRSKKEVKKKNNK